MAELTIVVDNLAGNGLATEHGLAVWIELAGVNLLLDTGMGAALLPNLETLGLDLARLDAVIMSHGHYDHFGGLAALLEARGGHTDVWCHPGCFGSHLKDDGRSLINIGPPLDKAAYRALGAEFHDVPHLARPWPGVTLLADMERNTPFEGPAPGLVCRDGGQVRPDPFPDDMAVVIDGDSGPVVITGCAHAGVINVLAAAEAAAGRPAAWLVGGTHLGPAPREQRLAAAAELAARPGLRVAAGHCTLDAWELLAAELGERFIHLRGGLRLEV